MSNLNEILELSSKTDNTAEPKVQPEKPQWLLSTILVCGFLVAGLLLVALTWTLCLEVIADEQTLFHCLHLAVFVVPGAFWALILVLTRRRDPVARHPRLWRCSGQPDLAGPRGTGGPGVPRVPSG